MKAARRTAAKQTRKRSEVLQCPDAPTGSGHFYMMRTNINGEVHITKCIWCGKARGE